MSENLIPAYNVVVKEESISHVESDVGNNCSPVYNVRVSSDVAIGSVSTVSCVHADGSLNNTYVSINSTVPESFIPANSVDGQHLFPVKREVLQNGTSVADMAMDKEVCPMDVKIILDKISVETTPSRQPKNKVTAETDPSHSKKNKATASTKSRKKKAPVVTPHTVTLESVPFASLQSLLKDVDAKGFSLIQTEKQIQFIQLYRTETPSIKLSVCIDEYFNCSISVHRQPVDRSHSIWKGLPDKFDDVSSVMELLDRINQLKVCCGSLQEKYHELVNIGGFLTNKSETDTITTVGFREGDFGAITPDGLPYSSTIRSTKCSLFIDRDVKAVSIRCKECYKLNDNVRRRYKVLQNQKHKSTIFVPSSVKHKDMTRDELFKTMDEHRAEINYLQSAMNRLNILYEKALKCLRDGSQLQPTDQQGVSDLDEDLDTSTTVSDTSTTVPESSSKQPISNFHAVKPEKNTLYTRDVRYVLFLRPYC